MPDVPAKTLDSLNTIPGPRAQIFRALIEIVRSYEPLGCIKTWIVGDGSKADNVPLTVGVMPAIRFRPYTVLFEEAMQQRRRISFGVYIDVFIPGTNFNHFLNVWDAIEDSVIKERMLPTGISVYQTLHGLNNCKGPQTVIVQQDICRDLTENDSPVARWGAGHIMLPFNKDS